MLGVSLLPTICSFLTLTASKAKRTIQRNRPRYSTLFQITLLTYNACNSKGKTNAE